MPLTLAIVRLRLVLEDQDLLALAVCRDLARHLRTVHHRTADLDICTVDNGQNLIENDSLALARLELLHKNGIALSDLVLLAARLYDCIHENTSLSRYSPAAVRQRRLCDLAVRLGMGFRPNRLYAYITG